MPYIYRRRTYTWNIHGIFRLYTSSGFQMDHAGEKWTRKRGLQHGEEVRKERLRKAEAETKHANKRAARNIAQLETPPSGGSVTRKAGGHCSPGQRLGGPPPPGGQPVEDGSAGPIGHWEAAP